MQSLDFPDFFRLQAAQGWLELGNVSEAVRELDAISPAFRAHPDVLEVRWDIAARAKDWSEGAEIGRTLVRAAPDRASSWLNLSYALHELKLTQEAWDSLLSVAQTFPKVTTIPFNLACYACQLGKLWEAERWLKRAMETGEPKEIKTMALQDEDLKPLRAKIQTW